MKHLKSLLAFGLIYTFLIQCETPDSPDFTLNSKVDTPLIANSTFQFLGNSSALIDTTEDDLQDLFSVDGDNFITLSKEEEYDFGDLEDAIPEVNVDVVSFETQIGEIGLDEFSSQDDGGNLGQADFSSLTGQPFALQEGDQLPAAQSPFPVNIELETDFFVSATIKSGGIEVSVRNELGFDISTLSLELRSGTNSLGTILFNDLNHNFSQTDILLIVDNPGIDPEVLLEEVNVNVEIDWNTQTMQSDAGALIVNKVAGQDLFASQVVAVVPDQDFFSSGVSAFSEDEFLFSDPSHFVEIGSGELALQNIVNQIDVDLDVLEISFPDIRTEPFSEADSLVIRFDGAEKIPRNNMTPVSRSVDLSGLRIFAFGNEVNYNIFAQTENTQTGSGAEERVINETDRLSADVAINDLVITEAFGQIVNKQVLLNEDDPSNGDFIDLNNEIEAEVIEIDGIEDLSKSIEGLEFTDASLSVNYFTNVDIQTNVIGAFLGTSSKGEQFFLKGTQGTPQGVTSSAPSSQLQFNSLPISTDDLIQFDIESSGDETVPSSITFDRNNSNITDFLNKLPTKIRFIGLANINEDNEVGTIKNPVRFDPVLNVNIPLAIRAENAVFTDTTKTDLGDLPGPEDDSRINEGTLHVQYENKIPLGIDLVLEFLDENEQLITTVPQPGESTVHVDPAPVTETGFSSSAAQNVTVINLSREQLDIINRTENIRLSAGLQSTNQNEVKVRDIDDVVIRISGRFIIDTVID